MQSAGTLDAIDAVMLMPPIARYMTRQPSTIRRDASLAQARMLMRDHALRHLPVLDAGRLVGILTERDAFVERDREASVEDAMTVDVYAVRGDDPVDEVVETMAAHKYGCAVVLDRRGSVEGIFTTVDGMQVLAEILRRACA